MNLPSDSESCPMCGARLGFSRTRCMSCGESLMESGPEEGSFEYYEQGNTRRWSKIVGFFVALVGLFIMVMITGAGLDPASDDSLVEKLALSGGFLFGLGWLIGGTLYFRGRSVGMWWIQPGNFLLLGVQLIHLDKLNVAMLAFNVLFLWLTHSCWRQLKQASAP